MGKTVISRGRYISACRCRDIWVLGLNMPRHIVYLRRSRQIFLPGFHPLAYAAVVSLLRLLARSLVGGDVSRLPIYQLLDGQLGISGVYLLLPRVMPIQVHRAVQARFHQTQFGLHQNHEHGFQVQQ